MVSRNYVPIPGATDSTYTVTMTEADPTTAIYSCILTNACGSTISNPFEVNKVECAVPSVVGLTSQTETETYSVWPWKGTGANCTYSFPPIVHEGPCESSWTTFTANTIEVALSVPYLEDGNRSRSVPTVFTVYANTTLSLSAVGDGGSQYSTNIGAISLSGAVEYWIGLSYGSPTASRTDVLPPGTYTLAVATQNGNGSIFCRGCGSCGPQCLLGCPAASAGRTLTILATLTPQTPCGNPASGSCCSAHAARGCADAVCCGTVCDVDPFCCNIQWDSICAKEARSMCNVCTAPGDLNGDGAVNGSDLATLLASWGAPAADLDGDGTVNGSDLAMLLANWG